MRNPMPSVVICVVSASIVGCAGGEAVTVASLQAAQAKWRAAGLADYDLVWRSSGARPGTYRVFVRGGEVKAIYTRHEGREIPAKPGQPRFYGVDGLFLTIAEDLAQLDQPLPFGKPRGTSVVMRFEPDPALGYPRTYVRDVSGSMQGISVEVLSLERSTAEIPPPIGVR
ncbi:MAG: DUF6174 domain-containing protein [Isosphaeraceae bacterium]|nr:DUF6174 domain-containing protein [Isosphaeraceae bacterium]